MIIRLEDASDISKFGGKAANLAILLKHGFRVPGGWAVSYDSFNSKGKLVGELLVDSTKLYAVRSSATVEDADDKSWAGQFETYLYVKPEDVIGKVEECHATSKERTKAYASEAGMSVVFKVAVVVQEMVDPAYAGVLFTKNPINGSDELVVEYVFGIGERLVSGEATPEQFSWERKTMKLSANKDVPFSTDELTTTGLKIESIYSGTPQDIEWAMDKTGKLWITQTRPITTANTRQSDKGVHYLGEPESLFYWGPATARPLYMSDFLEAEIENFNYLHSSSIYPNPPKTLLLFHDTKSLWLNKNDAFNTFVKMVFTVYFEHGKLKAGIADWHEAVSKIDMQKTYDPDLLLKLLKDAWRPTLIPEFALYGAESAINESLKSFSQEDRRRIWGSFSLPDKPTFINKIDQDVMKLLDAHELARKYDWSLNSYAGVERLEVLESYYSRRIKDLTDSKVLSGSAADRAKLIAEFDLSKIIVRQLDLAREIAEFMDDRKAWMMQSRKSIQRMAQLVSKRIGKSLEYLENCRIQDLTNTSPKTYYGWLYADGNNISIKEEDVQRSWEWYVDYRAAESILKGVVSSHGGRHFLSGEIIIVRDPSEQVPTGKIVVVPSTSPSYVPIMRNAAALITDHGGMMSHAAIVAREFNLPCIVGTVNATKVLKTGDRVVLDLVNGSISKVTTNQKSGEELSKFYEQQIPFTEWLERIGHKDAKAMRVENNYKRERLGEIAKIIPFPFDRPTTFESSELQQRTQKFKTFLAEHGEELCLFRLIPKKGVHAPIIRNRGKKIKDAVVWADSQGIDYTKYTAEFVPHMEVNKWSTVFVVSDNGIFGEIISDGHYVLTQGFYGSSEPITFTYDFEKWTMTHKDDEALVHLKDIVSYVRVDDSTKQAALKKKVSAEFVHSYMKGYFETVFSDETGVWFIDYSRTLGKNYNDFDPTLVLRKAKGLQGRVASAPQKTVAGKVRLVDRPEGIQLHSNEILVCNMTSPDYIPLMLRAKAIITNQGGILCHAAIVARELKIPCIVGTGNATEILKNGDNVTLDLTSGIIE